MAVQDVGNIFFVWLEKYGKIRWVNTGVLSVDCGIYPNYDPTAYCEAKVIRSVSVKIVQLQ
jgi:hypothetical protein